MFQRTFLFILFNLSLSVIQAQPYTSRQADSLKSSLSENKANRKGQEILIKIADYHVQKPGEFKTDMDSALKYLDQARADKSLFQDSLLKGYWNIVRSEICREQNDPVSGRRFSQAAVQCLKRTDNYELLGNAYIESANCYNTEWTEIQRKIALLLLGQKAFEAGGLIQRNAKILKDIGELYMIIEDAPNALKYLNRSLILYKRTNKPFHYGIYLLFGDTYRILADYKQALAYQLLALKGADQINDHSSVYCEINNHIGLTYMDLKDEKNAVPYFKAALETAKSLNQIADIYYISVNLVTADLRTNDNSSALRTLEELVKKYPIPNNFMEIRIPLCFLYTYIPLKAYSKAALYVKQLDNMMKTRRLSDDELKMINLCISKYYTAIKQIPMAVRYIKAGVRYATKSRDLAFQPRIYKYWFELDTTAKDYRSAVAHLLTFNKLNDSLYDITRDKQIHQLQVAYETAKKENDIRVLQSQDKLHQQELSASVDARKFYFIGIALLLLLLAAVYSRYLIKQKNNTELQIKQKEITAKNHELEGLLRENEWLLREVHHRVKNNLQIVMSLLNSQSVFLKDDAALNAVMESRHRVQAMSLIHQKLYKSNNISSIYMPDYVNDLLDYIKDSFKIHGKITFERKIESFYMDVLQAVPVGLILNESITNAVKHAFPDSITAGWITITLAHTDPENLLLEIADNGVGLPENFNPEQTDSFGMILMEGLAGDLGAKLTINDQGGTTIRLDFKSEVIKSRQQMSPQNT